MPAHKRTNDVPLPNGSIIYWSRREDPYVPVKCGSCGRERLLEVSNIRRTSFDGICRVCAKGESWQDETLSNGSLVFWSRRNGQRVPVQCGMCGAEHTTHAANIRKPTFTGLCRRCIHSGPLSTTWRGGRATKHGYIYVKVDPSHRFYETMANSQGYIAEHRLVMAEHLDRPLASTEVVHHKNRVKTDNWIENLELFTSFQDHGKGREQQHPHPSHESSEKFRQTFLKRLKNLFGSDEA